MADTLTWLGNTITTPYEVDARPQRQTHRTTDTTDAGVQEVWVHRIDRSLEVTIEYIPASDLASYEALIDHLMAAGTVTLTTSAASAEFELAADGSDPQFQPMEAGGYYQLTLLLRRVDGQSTLPFVTS